jgi:glucokinase
MKVLAVDLGGSHAACALVGDGSILKSENLPITGCGTLAEVLPKIGAVFHRLLENAHLSLKDCSALTLGFCGIVSPHEKRVLATNQKFEDATQLNLEKWCGDEFGLPFLIENDARLALLGEHQFGAARGREDAVMVTLGSGVGGAALLNGKLLESKHGLAGTIGGHLPVNLNGRLCSCGNRGCAESEASTAFLSEIYRAQESGGSRGVLREKTAIGFAELFDAIEAGDAVAAATLAHCLHVWSVLTVALIHAYDPEVVVFGGSVMKRAASILPGLQDYVDTHAWTPGRTVCLRAAELGSDAALLGAIPLIRQKL